MTRLRTTTFSLGAVAWALCAVIVATAAGARAQPPAPAPDAAAEPQREDVQARTLFLAGQTYYDQGEYELALEQFERAYALSPRSLLLLNATNAAERAGNLPVAIRHLEEYLAQEPEAPNRETLERRLDAMQRRLARQEAGASQEEPTTSETAETTEAADAEAGAPEDVADVEDEPRVGIGTPAIIAYSAGGAGLALFTTFGALTLTENSSLADGCGATRACSEDDLSSLRTYGILADVGMGIGIAGAAAGTVLLILHRKKARGNDEGAASVTPWLDRTGGGANVVVAF